MNAKTIALLAAFAAPAFAQQTLPPIQATTQFVTECAHPSLPSQRQVGEWTGLQNFGQVYAARERLMGDIGRACQQPGIGRVQVVMQADPRQQNQHFVAVASQNH